MINAVASNNFFSICKAVSNRAEEKIKEFDGTRQTEFQKVFLQGIMHTAATLGVAYLTGKPTEFTYDYNAFLKLSEKYEKEMAKKDEKAHQISMEEYLEEKNKEEHIEDLAEKVAEIILKKTNKNEELVHQGPFFKTYRRKK